MASFYLDNDVDIRLAAAVVDLGHEAVTTVSLGLRDSGDGAQLLLTAKRAWILVTHNRDDFIVLHDAWLVWTAEWNVALSHSGVLVIPQRSGEHWSPRHAAEELDRFVSSGRSLANELFQWRSDGGWQASRLSPTDRGLLPAFCPYLSTVR